MLADGRWLPYRTCTGEPGSALAALRTLADDFAPFAARLYYSSVPGERMLEAHIKGRINPDFPFSYVAINFMAGADLDIGGLEYECNSGKRNVANESNLAKDGTNKGMDIHTDNNSADTVVLTIGAFGGHAQLWPSCGVAIPLQCWGASVANSRDLLHGVGPGTGFRITLVYTVHMSVADSGKTAWGADVAWELGPVETQPTKDFQRARKREHDHMSE